MNIALIGYGKMGKEIEQIAISRGHSINLIIDKNNLADLDSKSLQRIDVAIEFTTPESAISNYKTCIDNNIPIVSGTTGWLDKFDEITEFCNKNNGTFFYASNFSLGVNIFFELNNHLSKIMNNYPDYNIDIEEIHHTQKLDKPSGTAISLADIIINNLDEKDSWSLNKSSENKIKIDALREENVPGTHKISYFSEIDKIELTHTAFNRKGFALGAVLAAEFAKNNKGMLSMKDLLKF